MSKYHIIKLPEGDFKLTDKSLKVLGMVYDWLDCEETGGYVDGFGRGGHSLNVLKKKNLVYMRSYIYMGTIPGHDYYRITDLGIKVYKKFKGIKE